MSPTPPSPNMTIRVTQVALALNAALHGIASAGMALGYGPHAAEQPTGAPGGRSRRRRLFHAGVRGQAPAPRSHSDRVAHRVRLLQPRRFCLRVCGERGPGKSAAGGFRNDLPVGLRDLRDQTAALPARTSYLRPPNRTASAGVKGPRKTVEGGGRSTDVGQDDAAPRRQGTAEARGTNPRADLGG